VTDVARVAVVTFPGSNDDGDARLALESLGADAVPVWHTERTLPTDVGGVVLPGGFSYGDYLRCGAIARVAPVMDAVRAFAADGGPATPFTAGCAVGQRLVIPVKHGEGCWTADDALAARVTERDQVVLRYVDEVNGSRERIAGLANEEGNVLGLMPHPEHAVDPLLGPTGGVPLLEGLVAAARGRVALVRV
jgi:phosphoribosylformylglycinamidine synthase